jgi:hypothetical protein
LTRRYPTRIGGSGKLGSSTGAWDGNGSSSGSTGGLGVGVDGGDSGSGVEWATAPATGSVDSHMLVMICLSAKN